MAKRWPSASWICLVPGGTHLGFVCWRCDAAIHVMLPAPLGGGLTEMMRAFANVHRSCRPTLRSQRRELTRALRRRMGAGPDGDLLRVQAGPW